MKRILFDIETNGLMPEVDTFHCAVAIDLDTEEVRRYRPQDFKEFCKLLEGAELLVGHNIISYDKPVLLKFNPSLVLKAEVRDTLVLSKLIWSDIKSKDYIAFKLGKIPGKMIGRHSLEAWGYRLGDRKGAYAKQENAWEKFSEEMLKYCEQDVMVNYKLWKLMLSKKPSLDSVELEHRFQEIIFMQEQWGVKFNIEKASVLLSILVQKKDELTRQLQEIFPPKKVSRGIFTPKVNRKDLGYVKGVPMERFKIVVFNPGSADQIIDRLQEKYEWEPMEFTDKGNPKMDNNVMEALPYPEAPVLAEYLMVAKRLSQLSTGKQSWLNHVKADGRIYGQVNTGGTVTGRCAHFNPNLGQVPAVYKPYGKECRELFEADEGWVLVGCDASGLEIRTLAHYMNDLEYTKEVLDGDIHTKNQQATEIPTRDKAKTWFYGFLYGAGNALLGFYILGVGFTKKEYIAAGKKARGMFLENIPSLGDLQEGIANTFKKKRKWLFGLDKRKLPIRSPHSALNLLLQSAGAIAMKRALVIAYDKFLAAGYVPGKDFKFVLNVHDEIQTTCPTEIADHIGQMKRDAIKEAGEYYKFNCPLDAEYKIGSNWAETH